MLQVYKKKKYEKTTFAIKPLFLMESCFYHVMLFQLQFILFRCGKYKALFVIVLAPGCVEC